MKKKGLLLIILVLLESSLFLFSGGVSAQDINVDSMSNEQLMLLLQAIMQKLEQTEAADEAVTPVPEIVSTPEAAGKIFNIYENKKLILERMPDWYFYQAPEIVEEDDTPPEKKKKTPEECEYHCAYEVCSWGDNLCYFTCYYPCLGQPIPDWAKP